MKSRNLNQRKSMAIQHFKSTVEDTKQKDFSQIVQEKLIGNPKSDWNEAELLYYTKTIKRSKSTKIASAADVYNSHSKSDRFILVVKKTVKDDSTTGGVFLMNLIVRGQGSIEIKGAWDIRRFKGVDAGNDDDLILSHEPVDSTFYFANRSERDEAAWIIVQICKASNHLEISVGYLIDMDSIGYVLKTNGTLNRFQTLHVLLASTGHLNGEEFGAEEAEAESVLEDMKWTSQSGAPIDLKETLSKQSESLNVEIIDFLLQWEELDDAAKISSSNTRVRDTVEILEALNQVDKELDDVNCWLGDQIDRLLDIQSNLHLIEDESGGLETSWQNLKSIHEIIKRVIDVLSIEEEEEAMLKVPDSIILSTLKGRRLDDIDESINPLIDAARKLQIALSFKGFNNSNNSSVDNVTESGIVTSQVWKQLQSMSAIVNQRQKLLTLGEVFCNKCNDVFPTFLFQLFKHPSLNDEDNENNINISHFNIAQLIKDNDFISGDSYSNDSMNMLQYFQSIDFEDNCSLTAQRIFHGTLIEYATMVDKVVEINPLLGKSMAKCYIDITMESLYGSLSKSLQKELRSLLFPKHQPVTLATISRYKYGIKFEVPVKFRPWVTNSTTGNNGRNHGAQTHFTPWAIFELLLLKLQPVISREESFFQVNDSYLLIFDCKLFLFDVISSIFYSSAVLDIIFYGLNCQ